MRSYANFPHWRIGTTRRVMTRRRSRFRRSCTCSCLIDFTKMTGRMKRASLLTDGKYRRDVLVSRFFSIFLVCSSWELAIPDTRGTNVNNVLYVCVCEKWFAAECLMSSLEFAQRCEMGRKINDIQCVHGANNHVLSLWQSKAGNWQKKYTFVISFYLVAKRLSKNVFVWKE